MSQTLPTCHGLIDRFCCCHPSLASHVLPRGSNGKEFACKVGALDLIPGSRRFPGEGNGHLLQSSFLESSTDRGAWLFTIHRIAKCQTQLSD